MDDEQQIEQSQQAVISSRSLRAIGAGFGLSVAVVIGIMNFFNPLDIGPYGLLGFFVAVYGCSLCIALTGAVATAKLWQRKFNTTSFYTAAVIALAPIMLLALSTLGQLKITDFVLVVIFEFLAVFYITRRRLGV